jgi:peptidoglycan/LPS O-acetylase OafA/YrhL
MNHALSLYLDLLRALAAIAVYIFHAQYFSRVSVPVIGQLGDEAVIVFFVLSGLLISSARAKHVGVHDFMMARLARLWSVCLPALVLTVVADTIGQYLSLAAYSPMQPYGLFKWFASLTANATFLNQLWNLNIYPGTNGPFWSLSYEFWYYAIFAVAVFLRRWARVGGVCLVALIAGPKIMVGLPIWIMGAGVYGAIRFLPKCKPAVGQFIWAASFGLAVAFWYFDVHDGLTSQFPLVAQWAAQQWAVDFWPTSYLVGAIVAMNIYGFACIAHQSDSILTRLAPAVRTTASASFGLYLFHYPLMYLVKAVLWSLDLTDGYFYVALVYSLPFVMSVYLALLCERHKALYLRTISGMPGKLGMGRGVFR